MSRAIVLSLFLTLGLASSALAQQQPIPADRLEAAQQVLVASDQAGTIHRILKPMMDTLMAGMMNQMQGENADLKSVMADPEGAAIINRFIGKLTANLSASMDEAMPGYLQKIRDLYAGAFTIEELNGLRDFYLSPAGRAYLAKTPMLAQQATAYMVSDVMPKLQAGEQPVLAEFKAEILEYAVKRAKKEAKKAADGGRPKS